LRECNVGNSGLRVSAVGLGCNNLGWTINLEASREVVNGALDAGITLFDTADCYGNPPGNAETVLGKCLGSRRKDVVLITKFGVPLHGPMRFNNSRRYIMHAIEGSLTRLGTEWVDVYMIHWPDPASPMEETLRAVEDLMRCGKARYVACSNLDAWRIADAQWIARRDALGGLIATQNEYSLLSREIEKDIIPAAEHFGMGLIPYFPLAGGMLTGKYARDRVNSAAGRLKDNLIGMGDRFFTETNFTLVEQLTRFSEERGHSLLELAMSWLASKPVVASIIAGATTADQVRQNVRAAQWQLDPQTMQQIDQLLTSAIHPPAGSAQ
jgi:aryl-alcohol dehydrogenase-like predicted oxidoreductase